MGWRVNLTQNNPILAFLPCVLPQDARTHEESQGRIEPTENHDDMFVQYFGLLGLGRPSAGGPRMDRRVVTSQGVVKVSRLASRLRRSARRGQGGLK